jgi:hypothetical protein
MSTQGQVNASPQQYILYYMGVEQKDTTVYPTDLSGVCDIAFTEDNPPEVVCNNWSVTAYGAPSNATLLTFSPANVFTWYDGFYLNPQCISDAQPFKISATNLANVRTTSDMIGYVVYNTTTHRQQYFDGTNWVSMW